MQARQIREFPGASYTAPPIRSQIGLEQAVTFMSRPEGGGPMCVIHVLAGDGRDLLDPIDMRQFGYQDCFGAAIFASGIDGTIKLFVNVKLGDANDRGLVLVETGIVPAVTR
jgi:hypothetical protein